jgi:hypothetical protein
MQKADVLVILIKVFRDLNAFDKTLTDAQAAQVNLTALPLLVHAGDQKPLVEKDLYARTVAALTEAHPNKVAPVMVPQSPEVFERAITLDTLAQQIADNTPDAVL